MFDKILDKFQLYCLKYLLCLSKSSYIINSVIFYLNLSSENVFTISFVHLLKIIVIIIINFDRISSELLLCAMSPRSRDE